MTQVSTAVGSDRISRTVGYKLRKGFFNESSPNLPQRIAILGQANLANQATLVTDPFEFTTAQEVGERFGFGSPLHQIARILRPKSGDGIGGIPTVIYPQEDAEGATQTTKTVSVTVSTAADANATHYLWINGRDNIDGTYYAISIVSGDTKAQITTKIIDCINAIPSSPIIATAGGTAGSETAILKTKWCGDTSKEFILEFDTGDENAGVTYTIDSTVNGAGVVSLTTSLAAFGAAWNTVVINPYNDSSTLSVLEAFNGIPDPVSPTGRYAGIVFKPFIAIFGTTEDVKADLIALTSARSIQVTNAAAPAPKSNGYSWEAAANMAYLFARTAQDSPHLDIDGQAYPDMPVPSDGSIGDMADYTNRDAIVKAGCSTVDFIAGKYVVQDFVTTYHPAGEEPAQFRYCRNLMLDFNIRYGYFLLEAIYVMGKTITSNSQIVTVSDVIKPKDWKQILASYADDIAARALSADAAFMKAQTIVQISSVNPNRFETLFKYKRTATAKILSTDAVAGFNFGV